MSADELITPDKHSDLCREIMRRTGSAGVALLVVKPDGKVVFDMAADDAALFTSMPDILRSAVGDKIE